MTSHHIINVESSRQFLSPEHIAQTLGLTLEAAQAYRHPTPTDLPVLDYVLDRFSQAGDMVLDPTCGVGTFAKHALIKGRDGYGSDVVEDYIKLGNADIEKATGHKDHLHVCSALALSQADWLKSLPPVKLCFFSPALPRISRNKYPESVNQLGNIDLSDHQQWVEFLMKIISEVHQVLDAKGYMVLNTRNQDASSHVIPNIHIAVMASLGIGYRLVEEKVIAFPQDPGRWIEYLLVFQKVAE